MTKNAETTLANVSVPTPPAPCQLTDDDLAILRASIPEFVKEREPDIVAFWEALPRLLAEGQEGRCALVHAGQVVSLRDALGDATQAATTSTASMDVFRRPSSRNWNGFGSANSWPGSGRPCPS